MAKKSMYLYGKNPVLERLRENPRSVKRIFLQDNFNAPELLKLIESKRISLKRVTEKELCRIKRADRLQGIVAEVEQFRYVPFSEIVERRAENRLSLLMLDGLNDPHNLGSIIRIAACFGGFAVVIPRHGACEVNETVLHVASGGENFVPVAMVSNLAASLRVAKQAGYWAAGAVVEGGEDLYTISFPQPLCLVLGSEGKGIRHGLRKLLDMHVTLKMKGAPLSFNVAMACAVFAHEIVKGRNESL